MDSFKFLDFATRKMMQAWANREPERFLKLLSGKIPVPESA